MDFIKKRVAKLQKDPVGAEKEKEASGPMDSLTPNSAGGLSRQMEGLKTSDSDGFIQQHRTSVVQTNRRVFVTSSMSQKMVESISDGHFGAPRPTLIPDHLDSDDVPRRSPSPFRLMPNSRSMFAFDNTTGFETTSTSNGSTQFRSKMLEIGDGSSAMASRRSVDALSLLRQCEGSAVANPKQSLQEMRSNGSPDPMDLVIEATLQKTMETFQRMVEDQRAELVRMFPQLGNVRRTATTDQGPGTDVVTETRVQPDGTVIEVQTVRTRRVLQMHKSINIVNGVVKNTHARAVMEYQGPNGGYRLKLEEDAGQGALPDAESETEEDDDDSDRQSMAPSEISDTTSVVALTPRNSGAMGKSRGDLVPQLQQKPKKKIDKAWYAAQELVESERRYVEKLKLLDQVCVFLLFLFFRRIFGFFFLFFVDPKNWILESTKFKD